MKPKLSKLNSLNNKEVHEIRLALSHERMVDARYQGLLNHNAGRGDSVDFIEKPANERIQFAFKSGLFPQLSEDESLDYQGYF